MSNDKQSGGFLVQVVAGALAAATAALLGSTLGVAGTVVGAGVASIVTTIAAALYLRSLQRTRHGVKLVQDRLGRWTGTIPKQEEEPARDRPEAPKAGAGRKTWIAVAAASVVAFALGMLVITGLEMMRGEPLSGGQGTTIGEIVRPVPERDRRPDPTPTTPATPTRPDATSSVPAPPPSTTTPPPTSSTPPTTTTPPPRTTPPPAPSVAPPPSEIG